MQHHSQVPRAQETSTLPSGLNPPVDALLPEVQLNAYLDSICALMPSEVPALAIAQMRREMHDHLEAALASLGELGYSPEEAFAHALAQFGEPCVVAKHWREEWERTLSQTEMGTFWPSLKLALKTWTATHVALFGLWAYAFTHPINHGPQSLDLLRMAMCFGPPIGIGAYIGLRARRRPVACALLGYVLTLPVLALAVLLFIALMHTVEPILHITGIGTSGDSLQSKLGLGVTFYTFMVLPLSFAGTCVTALGRSITMFARRQFAH